MIEKHCCRVLISFWNILIVCISIHQGNDREKQTIKANIAIIYFTIKTLDKLLNSLSDISR
jgi:hypothetical protein